MTPTLILFSVPGKTLSVLKTHSSIFTDVNGQREGHAETNEKGNTHTYVCAEGQCEDKPCDNEVAFNLLVSSYKDCFNSI